MARQKCPTECLYYMYYITCTILHARIELGHISTLGQVIKIRNISHMKPVFSLYSINEPDEFQCFHSDPLL